MTRKVDLTMMSVPRARKGEAAPMHGAAAEPGAGAGEGGLADEQPAAAQPPALPRPRGQPSAASAGAAAPIVPRKARERGEPRSPVTTRLTYSVQDRLFRAATILGQSQQALIEEAIDDLLRKNGL